MERVWIIFFAFLTIPAAAGTIDCTLTHSYSCDRQVFDKSERDTHSPKQEECVRTANLKEVCVATTTWFHNSSESIAAQVHQEEVTCSHNNAQRETLGEAATLAHAMDVAIAKCEQLRDNR